MRGDITHCNALIAETIFISLPADSQGKGTKRILDMWRSSPTEVFSISKHDNSSSSSSENPFLCVNGWAARKCFFVDFARAAVINRTAVRSHRADKSEASQ